MQPVSILSKSNQLPINSGALLAWTDRLCRMGYLSTLLVKAEGVEGKVSSLGAVFSVISSASEDPDEVGRQLCVLAKIDRKIYDLYAGYFDTRRSTTACIKKTSRMCLDEVASSVTPPLSLSKRGLNGPTCFVSYSDTQFLHSRDWPRSAVFKWTGLEEKLSTEIYKAISNVLDPSIRFYVPRSTYMDFDRKKYIGIGGVEEECSTERSLQIEQGFRLLTHMASVGSRERDITAHGVLLSEKIQGSTLFDFIQGPYKNLTIRQQKELFKSIGVLSLVDLVFIQEDRLLPLTSSFSEFSPRGVGNLGNLMFVPPKNEDDLPILYAIDNDIFDHEEGKASYHSFFADFISTEDMSKNLSDTVLTCLNNSLQPGSFLFRGLGPAEVSLVVDDIRPFSLDLFEFGKESCQQGIEEASRQLQEADLTGVCKNIPISPQQRSRIESNITIFQQVLASKESL